jgi:hypothetical protein
MHAKQLAATRTLVQLTTAPPSHTCRGRKQSTCRRFRQGVVVINVVDGVVKAGETAETRGEVLGRSAAKCDLGDSTSEDPQDSAAVGSLTLRQNYRVGVAVVVRDGVGNGEQLRVQHHDVEVRDWRGEVDDDVAAAGTEPSGAVNRGLVSRQEGFLEEEFPVVKGRVAVGDRCRCGQDTGCASRGRLKGNSSSTQWDGNRGSYEQEIEEGG